MHAQHRPPVYALLPIALALLLLGLACLLGGCASIHKQLDSLPAGSAEEVTYTRTGKWSSTTIEVKKWEKDADQVTAESLKVTHNNLYIPNLTISAKNYKRVREPKSAPSEPEAPKTP